MKIRGFFIAITFNITFPFPFKSLYNRGLKGSAQIYSEGINVMLRHATSIDNPAIPALYLHYVQSQVKWKCSMVPPSELRYVHTKDTEL